jgi:C4-dicarboxylate transporter DctQ subunit
MSAGKHQAKTPLGRAIGAIEETLIAAILGAMTLITFANVVARYVFNANLLWALEATVFLFAWLVLIGVSYCVKINANLGVDAMVNLFQPGVRKVLTLISVTFCIVFTALLLYGAWEYWQGFATKRAWYEVNDIAMPAFMNQFVADLFNDGDRYEKLPRFIPYFALPLGMALLLFRYIEAAIKVWKGELDLIIVSHEAEDAVEEAAAKVAKEG